MRKSQGLLFVLSGPSGSGKTTLGQRLLGSAALRKNIIRSISCTTRPKRSKERNAREYFFISLAEFRQLQKAKKILEWTRYLGYYYATLKGYVDKQVTAGKHLVLCLDVRGALRIRQLYPKSAILIFVAAPSVEVLRERIRGRCAKTKKREITQRLRLARKEMRQAGQYDYVLINNNLAQAVRRLKKIIEREIRSNKE